MPFVPFRSLFRKIADDEMRNIFVGDERGNVAYSYAFVEAFCDEYGCDCRRALLMVLDHASGRQVATLGYGWASADYYRSQFSFLTDEEAHQMTGLSLEPMALQSEISTKILALAQENLATDVGYLERIERHYAMFRASIDARSTPQRVAPKAGRNEQCPCGSGRKFKKCCLVAQAV